MCSDKTLKRALLGTVLISKHVSSVCLIVECCGMKSGRLAPFLVVEVISWMEKGVSAFSATPNFLISSSTSALGFGQTMPKESPGS